MLKARQITKLLEDYTAEHSHYETSRNYVSLSHCALSVAEIVDQYRNGFPDSLHTRLRCYKGYQMEEDLVMRIQKAFPEQLGFGGEITAFDGLVKGHPDFSFEDDPGWIWR